jgi:hypothetical protein
MDVIKPSQTNRKRNNNVGKVSQRKRQRHNRQQKKHPQKKPQACSVCLIDETPPKYKCPTCMALYCSVACCKKHKEICFKEKSQAKEKVAPKNTPSKYQHDDSTVSLHQSFSRRRENMDDDDDNASLDEDWKITEEMKNSLKHSEWLRNELKDGGLRNLIFQVVIANGDRKHLLLQQLKERYTNFKIFLDKMLLVTGVLECQEQNSDEEDTLERDWTDHPPVLALKQTSRPKLMFEPIQHSSSSSSSSEGSETSSEKSDSSSSSEE